MRAHQRNITPASATGAPFNACAQREILVSKEGNFP